MAACMMRTASSLSWTEPMCQPPRHRQETRTPVLPRARVGRPVSAASTVPASPAAAPPAGGVLRNSRPPLQWSDAQNVRWKTAIPGKGWSSPVLCGEQIWLTTAPEDGTTRSAVCLDRDSGKVVHDLKVFDDPQPQFCHAFNSYASPTPA